MDDDVTKVTPSEYSKENGIFSCNLSQQGISSFSVIR